jgi:thiol:disulfide interchange protein DsbC
LEKELAKLQGVTIYIFPYPLAGLHPNAVSMAEKIWCSDNKALAWDNYLQSGVKPADAHCATPIERNLAFGAKNKIFGTPSIIFSDGKMVPGLMPAAAIQTQIANSKSK